MRKAVCDMFETDFSQADVNIPTPEIQGNKNATGGVRPRLEPPSPRETATIRMAAKRMGKRNFCCRVLYLPVAGATAHNMIIVHTREIL